MMERQYDHAIDPARRCSHWIRGTKKQGQQLDQLGQEEQETS